MFDSSIYKEELFNFDIYLTKVYKRYLKAVNPHDVSRNKKLMNAFVSFFIDIDSKLKLNNDTGYFVVPLHRVFSYYFSRLMMHNYLVDREKF